MIVSSSAKYLVSRLPDFGTRQKPDSRLLTYRSLARTVVPWARGTSQARLKMLLAGQLDAVLGYQAAERGVCKQHGGLRLGP